MTEDIRALSAELAREPSSMVYVTLAEALRRRGRVEEALHVVQLGLARHPQHADGYDCLARVRADRGDLESARTAWERTLAIVPEHAGALRGLGFLAWREGRTDAAAKALEAALEVDPANLATRRALAMVRSGSSAPPDVSAEAPGDAGALPLADAGPEIQPARVQETPHPAASRPPVFEGFEGATGDILLLDERGLVLAGGLASSEGSDVSEMAAAAMAGVSEEAARTSGYIELGSWETIVAEAESANVVLVPAGDGALLMVRRDRSVPVGLAMRIAARAREVAASWLREQGA